MDIEKLMSESAAKKPASRRASNVTANVDFQNLSEWDLTSTLMECHLRLLRL